MDTRKELKILLWLIIIFTGVYFLPLENTAFKESFYAASDLLKWYAREHVILCLVPAFFIAGVIAVFVSQGSVIKYFGAGAKKWAAYLVAAVSGTILAVCSCTILPLFSSIHKRGAGLGPAIAFLYSGPAINILAIILTARILGFEMGVARVIGAVVFAVVIGIVMSLIYRKEEKQKREEQVNFPDQPLIRPMWQTSTHFFILVFILIFANWGSPGENVTDGIWFWIWSSKWIITSIFGLMLVASLIYILKADWKYVISATIIVILSGLIFSNPMLTIIIAIALLSIILATDKNLPENKEWLSSSWGFTKQIMPLLGLGVVIAGFLLGSNHGDTSIPGIIPSDWVSSLVGGNSILSNVYASVIGAFMYFATLTEVPILQGLMNAGMGKGPALALLLAGPSLSLPNMLVIRSVIGTQKTIVYVLLVIFLSTISGLIFGMI